MSSDITDSLRRASEDIAERPSKKCLKRFFSKMMIFQKEICIFADVIKLTMDRILKRQAALYVLITLVE